MRFTQVSYWAGVAGAPHPVVDERLREISVGSWDGMTYREIGLRHPAIFDGDGRYEWCFRSPDGESYETFAARVGLWLSEWGQTPLLVAVTHGIVSRVLRGLYAGLPRASALRLPVTQDRIFRLHAGSVEEFRAPIHLACG